VELIGSPRTVADELGTSRLHTHAGAKFSWKGAKHNPPMVNRWDQSMELSFLWSTARKPGLNWG
jgi:hypothetical protein